MLRTQISLTAEQMRRLRRAAQQRHTSVAAVIRDAVETCLGDEEAGRLDRQRRAFAQAGAFRSGHRDTAEHHDAALADERRW